MGLNVLNSGPELSADSSLVRSSKRIRTHTTASYPSSYPLSPCHPTTTSAPAAAKWRATWRHVFHPPQPSTPLQQHYIRQSHTTRPDKVVHYFKGSHAIIECTKHSRFLMQLAEWAPRAVLKQISLLLSQLDLEVRSHSIPFFIRLMQKRTNAVLSDADGHCRDHQPSHLRARVLRGPSERLVPHQDTLKLVHSWLSHHSLPSSSILMTHGGSSLKLTL